MQIFNYIGKFEEGTQRKLALPKNLHESACTVDLWRTFAPKVELPYLWLRRIKVLLHSARTFPPHRTIHFRDQGTRKWAVFFCYAPTGVPLAAHRFTIDRLRLDGFAVLVVCSTPKVEQAEKFLDLGLDGLIWKALRGYDFSGYSAGLSLLAQRCTDIDVLVMNDSVFGPFYPLRPFLDDSPWDVTGFTTSYSVEHHIQSYAFYLKGFGHRFFCGLRRVFCPWVSFDSQGPVSLLQETRLGSAVEGKFSVGAILTPSVSQRERYLLLSNPMGLLDRGFPFLKKSIFTKFASGYDQSSYRNFVEAFGHPEISVLA